LVNDMVVLLSSGRGVGPSEAKPERPLSRDEPPDFHVAQSNLHLGPFICPN